MNNRVTKSILIAIAVLFLSYFIKDWVDLARCGAHDSCLTGIGSYQSVTKFATSFLLTVLAFYVSRFASCPQDGRWLKIAFVFSLMAVFCFRILTLVGVDLAICDLLGITGFMLFQSAMIHRHTRTNDNDKHFSKVFIISIVTLVLAVALCVAGILSQLVAIVVVYAGFLIPSLVVGIKAGSWGYFSKHKSQLIKIGMIVFFIGDALVGFALAIGDEGSVMDWIAAVANNLIWIVYVPAQLLLIKSCGEE